MPPLELLTKLHDAIEKVKHLAVLRDLTSSPIDKMYGKIPMDEFINLLISDLHYLKTEQANTLLKNINGLGTLEIYLNATKQMRAPEFDPSVITGVVRPTLALAEHDTEMLVQAIAQSLYPKN